MIRKGAVTPEQQLEMMIQKNQQLESSASKN